MAAGLVGLVRRSPPGDTSLAMSDNSALVQRFVDTYNRGDTEAIVALVTPDVELETPGGLERGPEAAQRLAAKSTQDHALVHIEIERLVEAGDQVVVFAERQMRWRETGELADASPKWVEPWRAAIGPATRTAVRPLVVRSGMAWGTLGARSPARLAREL
jgi:ketosteroid isomerase-like protein